MKIFIISSVRNADPTSRVRLENYCRYLENMGHSVHLPHRDTDQTAMGIDICRQNMEAIRDADEVYILYNGESQGTHFDMGMAFAFGKRIVVVKNEPYGEGKSFSRMLDEWSERV
jgi:nucleoside 2-deoxyribosyltransferase